MLDLTQTFFGVSLWLWMIGSLAVILLFVVIARKLEFEGITLTAMPPFIQFRFKRKSVPPSGSPIPPPPAHAIGNVTTRGDAQIMQGAGAHAVQTGGGDYIEQYIAPPPPERPPRGSGAPPTRTAHYVSRGEIQAKVRAALESHTTVAVVGVAGMGGIGKTELAKYLCGEFERELDHHVIWIGVYNRLLADLQNELARALGITFPPNSTDESRYETLRAAFHDNPRIVFFDDVYRTNLPTLKFLIPPSPPCAALITSRQRELGVTTRVFELDVMTEAQSLELMREAHDLADALAREPDAARELCHLCGYLPLALDIAASRLRKQRHFSATPVAAFNQTLANRLKELQRGAQPSREDSITANIAISYDDLDDADRRRLRALAVFAPSGFAPRAAAAAWGEDEADARTSIERLQDGSLVMDAEAMGRFRLHDLVRDYAAQKLNECGESDAANRAHAEFLIALFEEQHMVRSSESQPAFEFDNLAIAAKWACETNDGELLARLATTPRNWLYNVFRAWDVWNGWLTDALRIGKDYKPDLRANVLKAMGDVQQFRDDRDTALASYAQALELFRAVGDRLGEANVLQAMGDVQQFRKDMNTALASYAQALELFRAVGSKLGEANVLKAMGDVQQFRDDRDAALKSYEQALALFRSVGDRLGEANVYLSLGGIQRVEKKFGEARENFRSALVSYQAIGDAYSQARALYRLGDCDADEEKWGDALAAYRQAAQIWNDLGMTKLVDEILKPRIENAEKNRE